MVTDVNSYQGWKGGMPSQRLLRITKVKTSYLEGTNMFHKITGNRSKVDNRLEVSDHWETCFSSQYSFRVSKSTIMKFIMEVCEAIIQGY